MNDDPKTTVIRAQLYADRWATFRDRAGIRRLSSLLHPAELRRYPPFADLADTFLEDLSPDISVAEWQEGAVLFEEGSYLDVAFWVIEGEVELFVARLEARPEPIFHATRIAAVAEPAAPDGATQVLPRFRESATAGSIAVLATEDWDLPRGERMRLGTGDVFGEIGALNGWPQSVTARAVTTCKLLQVRVPALRKLRQKSSRIRERLDEVYRSRTLRQHLASTPILRDCGADVIEGLAQRVELVSYEPSELVTQEGDVAQHLMLVRSGFLRMSQALGAGEMVVSYLSKGSTLGEVEMLIAGLERWQATTTSVGYAELVRIPKAGFLDVVQRHPGLRDRLWALALDRIAEIGFTRDHPHRADLLDFALAKGLVQGNSMLVIDLDVCTRCDDCVRGCASTHGGIPRFVREGDKYHGFLIPRSCYHCEDPVCLIGCPTGAIRRTNVGEVVAIDPALCIGCSACADSCPYDAIVMHDLGVTWTEDALPKRLRGQPRALASKCDLCYQSPAGPACVSSCPQGCAHRVTSLEEFDALIRAKAIAQGIDQDRETWPNRTT